MEGWYGVCIWIFFSQSGKDLDRTWGDIYPKLRSAREEAIAGWQCVLDVWASRRRRSVEEKERLYVASRVISFSENADWPTSAGLAAPRICVSAEPLLFFA